MHIVAIILYHIFISLAKQYKKDHLNMFLFFLLCVCVIFINRLFRLFIDGLLNVCHGVCLFVFSFLHCYNE